ncbi:MAG: hypothetical protein K0S76_491 [Herbinix sp.]|nr:hypothetical protein [Herbinix sp.]
MNNRKNGLLVWGILGLLFGIWMSFAGFVTTTSDQYKEEVAFDGVYGSETIDEANMMIGVGLVILVVGVIMIVYGKKKADASKNNYEAKNSTEQSKKTDYYPNNSTYKPESNAIEEASSPITPLLRRAEIFLEDGNFNSADEYFNRVLDIDPECSKAYIGLLLVEYKLTSINELVDCSLNITESGNYKKALRFADSTYMKVLEDLDPLTLERKENNRKESIYNKSERVIKLATSSRDYIEAYELFKSISGYKDADQRLIKCNEQIKESEKAEEEKRIKAEREEAERLEQARITEKQRELRNKKIKKVSGISFLALVAVSTVIIVTVTVVIPWFDYLSTNSNYSSANKLLLNKQYSEAVEAFSELGDFKESKAKVTECQYGIAMDLYTNRKYSEASQAFSMLRDFKDSKTKISECEYRMRI